MPIPKAVELSRIRYTERTTKHKIWKAEELIAYALKKHGDRVAVSASFGACSTVVLHLVLQQKPDVKVIFNNTGVEYKETYKYRDRLKKEWNLNLIETKPYGTIYDPESKKHLPANFWTCVKVYGLPLTRAEGGKPKCCEYLKEYPLRRACLLNNINALITGIRLAESSVRLWTIQKKGMYYYSESYFKHFVYHPIAYWSHDEVIDYFKTHDIPLNEMYIKGNYRTGCVPCTSFLNWEKDLAKYNKKLYALIQKMKGKTIIDNWLEYEEKMAEGCQPDKAQEKLPI